MWFNLVFWLQMAYDVDDGFKMRRAIGIDDNWYSARLFLKTRTK